MGSMDKDVACLTCDRAYNEQDAAACPGHFGHIELEMPIPKIMYLGIEKNDGKRRSFTIHLKPCLSFLF